MNKVNIFIALSTASALVLRYIDKINKVVFSFSFIVLAIIFHNSLSCTQPLAQTPAQKIEKASTKPTKSFTYENPYIEEQYQAALVLYLNGEYKDSLQKIRSIFNQVKDPYHLRLLAATNYIAMKKYRRAQLHIRAAERAHSDRLEPIVFYAKLLREKKQYRASLRVIQTAIRRLPKSLALHLEAAAIYYQIKNYNQARKQLWKVLELDTQNYYAFYLDGLIFLQQRRYKTAEFRFRNAEAVQSQNKTDLVLLYNNLGVALEAQGWDLKRNRKAKQAKSYYTQAKKYYSRALVLAPKNATLRNNIRRINR